MTDLTVPPADTIALSDPSADVPHRNPPAGWTDNAGWRRRLAWRRCAFALLVIGTVAGLGSWMASVLAINGLEPLEAVMLGLYLITTPWIAVGLWNAVIGVTVLRAARNPVATVAPLIDRVDPAVPIRGRIAVIMPVFNEDPNRVFTHLAVVASSLEKTGQADLFDIHLLSDSTDPQTMADERARFARWSAGHPRPGQIHYRHRSPNTGRKVGNIKEFVDRCGGAYDAMVVLDADSVMTGEAIVRLVRVLQANPDAGIIQALSLGLPSASAFARLFQFGMRHGMRVYATGQAWWQGDEGPYWGHNAAIRMAAFKTHCDLPEIPKGRLFAGQIISHDQIEAVRMRAAGYGVWVIPEEGGSYEENPPTYFDYLKRDLRWCQGNLQYLGLIGMPGFTARPMGWFQIAHAILMYLSVPAWLLFVFAGFSQAAWHAVTVDGPGSAASVIGPLGSVTLDDGLALFVTMMALVFAPKLIGVVGVLTSVRRRQGYGGAGRLIVATMAEIAFSILLAPVIAVAVTMFIIRLLLGRRVAWDAQERDAHAVPLAMAVRGLWPQMLVGMVFACGLAWAAPNALPWAVPFFGALLVAVPFACITADPRFGRWLARNRVAATPEEYATPVDLAPVVAATHAAAQALAAPEPVRAPELAPAIGTGGE